MQTAVKFLLVLFLAFSISFAQAGEVETQVALVISKEYAKEQLKHELARFLNAHPKVIGTFDPQIGTKSMKVLSKAISIYNFISAKSDGERFWASAQLTLCTTPLTCAAVVGAQLVDTLMSLRSSRDIMRIRQETIELWLEASKYAVAAGNLKNLQLRILFESLESIFSEIHKRNTSIQQCGSIVECDLELLLSHVLGLSNAFGRLDQLARELEEFPLNEIAELEIARQDILKDVRAQTAFRQQISQIDEAVLRLFVSVQASLDIQKIETSLTEYREQVYQYLSLKGEP